jgi:uncharacterized protein
MTAVRTRNPAVRNPDPFVSVAENSTCFFHPRSTQMIVIPVSAIFIGIFAVFQIPLTIMVGYRRARTGIQFFDGGDQILLRRMRAHGNYTETVPIVLLAMVAAEVTGAPSWLLWVGGASLLAGRAMHAAILVARGWGLPRAIGMILTFMPMLGFGVWCLSHGAQLNL